jgi:hypothetical protein
MAPQNPTVTRGRLEDLVWLIDAEYHEMPGMRLTFAQVKRLWDLSAAECVTVLEFMVRSGRLERDFEGRFYRVTDW